MSALDCILIGRVSVLRPIYRSYKQSARDPNSEPSAADRKARAYFGNVTSESIFGQFSIGPVAVVAWDTLLTQGQLDRWDEFDPGATGVLWVGDAEGIPHGITRTWDNTDPENPIEVIEGTPTYPASGVLGGGVTRKAAFLMAAASGDPPTPPADWVQHHKYLGWADRRFDLV